MSYSSIMKTIKHLWGPAWKRSARANQALKNMLLQESKSPKKYSTIVWDADEAKDILRAVGSNNTKRISEYARFNDVTPSKIIEDARKMLLSGRKSNPVGTKRNAGEHRGWDEFLTANTKNYKARFYPKQLLSPTRDTALFKNVKEAEIMDNMRVNIIDKRGQLIDMYGKKKGHQRWKDLGGEQEYLRIQWGKRASERGY